MTEDKDKGGRPSKYTPKMVELARDYLTTYKTKHNHEIPSIVGMAVVLKVGKSTLYDWSNEEDNEFSDILSECMDHQQLKLINGGLSGALNANITKLVLGKHGYSDKVDQTTSGTIGLTDMTASTLDEKILEMQRLLEQSTED